MCQDMEDSGKICFERDLLFLLCTDLKRNGAKDVVSKTQNNENRLEASMLTDKKSVAVILPQNPADT